MSKRYVGPSGIAFPVKDDLAPSAIEAGGPAFSEADQRATRIFCHIGFITCMLLQRFGILSGVSALFLALPVSWVMIGWVVLTHRAQVRVNLLLPFLAFFGIVAIGTGLAYGFPDNRVGTSLSSPLALLLNYIPFLFGPTDRFDRKQVLPIFILYSRLCAICGIVQYLAQFVGISVFSFQLTVPALQPILIEGIYNNNPYLTYGSSITRSNGFFFVEAAIYSQFVVTAVCVEYFVFKNLKFLPVYGVAILLSFSGTGVLCMAIALIFYSIFFFREAGRVAILAIVAVLIGASAFVILPPEQLGRLTERSDEFNNEGSSGYNRYIGQIASLDRIIDEPRVLVGYGPGATDRASFVGFGSGGTIQKLVIDYGIIGLFAFLWLLFGTVWRWDYSIVPLLVLSVYFFGGGKLFESYALLFMLLICVWSAPPKFGASRDT